MLIKLHGGNFTFTDAQPNGVDLRFVAGDDKTPLAYHIESYDAQTGVAFVWVDVPALSGGGKTNIFMYYGNKNATPALDTPGTFDADYAAVYHFSDKAGVAMTDATNYKNNAAASPAAVNPASIIAQGARFTGTVPLTVAASPSLTVPAAGGFTVSAWVKQDALTPAGDVVAIGPVRLGLANGTARAQIGGQALQASAPIVAGQWSHLALVSDGKVASLYLNGRKVAEGSVATPATSGPLTIGQGFAGEIDELRISKVARPAALILADAAGQGADTKLIAFGADEQQTGGGGAIGAIVRNTPVDAWVVIGLLGVLFALSVAVMIAKARYLGAAAKANKAFMRRFRQMTGELVPLDRNPDISVGERAEIDRAPLARLYETGMEELRTRRETLGHGRLTGESVGALRAAIEGRQVDENAKLDRWMVLLTIAISGGPFIGLLGTVLGVMLVFGEVALSGDVNVAAIAPGIAAALLATVAGLAVAIPALFAYNYLNSRIVEQANEMGVFVDRLTTRIAESQVTQATPPPHRLAAE